MDLGQSNLEHFRGCHPLVVNFKKKQMLFGGIRAPREAMKSCASFDYISICCSSLRIACVGLMGDQMLLIALPEYCYQNLAQDKGTGTVV